MKKWDIYLADVPFEEYQLRKWKEAGLIKPTTVRLSKTLNLDFELFRKHIGSLHPIERGEEKGILNSIISLVNYSVICSRVVDYVRMIFCCNHIYRYPQSPSSEKLHTVDGNNNGDWEPDEIKEVKYSVIVPPYEESVDDIAENIIDDNEVIVDHK